MVSDFEDTSSCAHVTQKSFSVSNDALSVCLAALKHSLENVPKFPPHYALVDSAHGLIELNTALENAVVIGIDIEHSQMSFHGCACTIQLSIISSRTDSLGLRTFEVNNFLIDALEESVRPEIHAHLSPAFMNPLILKALHSGSNDVRWLHANFGLFIVGLIDTYHLSSMLPNHKKSIGDMFSMYFGLTLDKAMYQRSDWRRRPLPRDWMDYAISDAVYLLPTVAVLLSRMILDVTALSDQPNMPKYTLGEKDYYRQFIPNVPLEADPRVLQVLEKCKDVTMLRYSKKQYEDYCPIEACNAFFRLLQRSETCRLQKKDVGRNVLHTPSTATLQCNFDRAEVEFVGKAVSPFFLKVLDLVVVLSTWRHGFALAHNRNRTLEVASDKELLRFALNIAEHRLGTIPLDLSNTDLYPTEELLEAFSKDPAECTRLLFEPIVGAAGSSYLPTRYSDELERIALAHLSEFWPLALHELQIKREGKTVPVDELSVLKAALSEGCGLAIHCAFPHKSTWYRCMYRFRLIADHKYVSAPKGDYPFDINTNSTLSDGENVRDQDENALLKALSGFCVSGLVSKRSSLEYCREQEKDARASRVFCPRAAPLYNNIELLSPSGILMARIDHRRAEWYVSNNLVEIVYSEQYLKQNNLEHLLQNGETTSLVLDTAQARTESSSSNEKLCYISTSILPGTSWISADSGKEPLRLRMLTEPRGLGHAGDVFHLEPRANVCVVCGIDWESAKGNNGLVRCYIVPRGFRLHMPLAAKSYASHDVVLTCVPCHRRADVSTGALTRQIAMEMDIPMSSKSASLAKNPSMRPRGRHLSKELSWLDTFPEMVSTGTLCSKKLSSIVHDVHAALVTAKRSISALARTGKKLPLPRILVLLETLTTPLIYKIMETIACSLETRYVETMKSGNRNTDITLLDSDTQTPTASPIYRDQLPESMAALDLEDEDISEIEEEVMEATEADNEEEVDDLGALKNQPARDSQLENFFLNARTNVGKSLLRKYKSKSGVPVHELMRFIGLHSYICTTENFQVCIPSKEVQNNLDNQIRSIFTDDLPKPCKDFLQFAEEWQQILELISPQLDESIQSVPTAFGLWLVLKSRHGSGQPIVKQLLQNISLSSQKSEPMTPSADTTTPAVPTPGPEISTTPAPIDDVSPTPSETPKTSNEPVFATYRPEEHIMRAVLTGCDKWERSKAHYPNAPAGEVTFHANFDTFSSQRGISELPVSAEKRLEAFVQRWREHFLATLRPSSMPFGWSVSYPVLTPGHRISDKKEDFVVQEAIDLLTNNRMNN